MAVQQNGRLGGIDKALAVHERMACAFHHFDRLQASLNQLLPGVIGRLGDMRLVIGKRADARDAQELEEFVFEPRALPGRAFSRGWHRYSA